MTKAPGTGENNLKCSAYLRKLKQSRPSSFKVNHRWFFEDYIISTQREGFCHLLIDEFVVVSLVLIEKLNSLSFKGYISFTLKMRWKVVYLRFLRLFQVFCRSLICSRFSSCLHLTLVIQGVSSLLYNCQACTSGRCANYITH